MRCWAITLATTLFGCGPVVGVGHGSADDGPTTTDGTTGVSTTTGLPGTSTSPPTTTGGEPSDSSSSGEPLDGPGCGVVPTCDRGELLGSMRIESSAQIDDIAGYTSVTGWLEIVDSDLVCLDFLACLTSVGHDIGIYDNAQLRSLDGTDAIVEVGGSHDGGRLIVSRNDALEELDGFGVLPRTSVIVVSSNAELQRISGFDSLDVVGSSLSIRFHPMLEDLGPLTDLLALGFECQITNNPRLCLSEVYAVCGDLKEGGGDGNTMNNDETCLGDAPPGFLPGDADSNGDDCSPWAQDCPPGEKCAWWANDGGNAWNATRCVPLDPDAVGVGESCTVEGSPVTGIDSCDIGLMCWGVDSETNIGECVPLCVNNESRVVCEYADHVCSIGGEGLGLCLPGCDPLAQDCDTGDVCVGHDLGFGCVPDVSGDMGVLGDPCEYINACDPGLYCAEAPAVPGCTSYGCCSEFCDVDVPTCSYAEQECLPFFELGHAPWGYEDVGVCAIL